MKKYFNFICLLIMFSLTMALTSCGEENQNGTAQAKHNSNEYTLCTDNNNYKLRYNGNIEITKL